MPSGETIWLGASAFSKSSSEAASWDASKGVLAYRQTFKDETVTPVKAMKSLTVLGTIDRSAGIVDSARR